MPRIQNKIRLHTLRSFLNKRIIPAVILIVVFNICFSIIGNKVNQIITETCYELLRSSTTQIAEELSTDLSQNNERLEAIAYILSGYPSLDGVEAQRLLDAYRDNSHSFELGIMLPDNRIMLASGESWDSDMTFKEESAKAPSLSSAKTDDSGRKYFHQSVPILKDGNIIGILFKFTDIITLSSSFKNLSYPSNAELALLDTETGDYILNTGNALLKNIYTDESIKLEAPEKLRAGFLKRSPGQIILVPADGEPRYSYYVPVPYADWAVMLAYSEETMFEPAFQIRHILNVMLIIEITLFLCYLIWLMHKNHQQSAQKEQQIIQMEGIIEIQEFLFDAHKSPSRVDGALKKTAHMLTAQCAFLIPTDNSPSNTSYIWPEAGDAYRKELDWDFIKKEMPSASSQLLEGYSVLFDTRSRKLKPAREDASALASRSVASLMLIPIFDSEQRMVGILGSSNMTKKWNDTDFLETIAHNYMMALENIRSYRIIEEMGTIDALTGLLNRNSYQKALSEQKDIYGCVYLDANGLHELNNQYGHAAGDLMLKSVADTLKAEFGASDTYRIGGDEYVALCRQIPKEDAETKLKRLEAKVQELGYHVSSGFSWKDTPAVSQEELKELVTDAEHLMYDAKKRYYASLGGNAKPRL